MVTQNSSNTRSGVSASQDQGLTFSSLFSTLWRRKLLIVFLALVAGFIGGVQVYVLATPTFRSTAVVMLNNREEQVVDIGNVVGGLTSESSVVNTETEVLKSRILLGKLVDRLDLTTDPEFNASLNPPSAFSRLKTYVRSLLTEQGVMETQIHNPIAKEIRVRESTISGLANKLNVSNVPKSLVFRVTFETTSGAKSAKLADTLLELYILNQLEVKFEATEQATQWLSERVSELQFALEDAEGELKTFRASTALVSPEALGALELQVKDTRERIADARTAETTATQALADLTAATTPQEKAEISKDPQLTRFLPRVNDPAIAAAFDTRFDQVLQRAQTAITRNASQVVSLERSLTDLETQISQQSKDLITLQQLAREAEASRLLYEYFLGRLKETSARQGIQQADSRVLSPAVVPSVPASPRKMLSLVMSIFLGGMLGVAYVLAREVNNRSIRSSRDLEDATGYSTLGQIPVIKANRFAFLRGQKRLDAISYLKENPASAVAESVRNLRTSVMLGNVETPPQVIMVCSSLPGEGKTTVSLSLTMNFASMGGNVLLIEGDIRRRIFDRYFDAKDRKGIVSVLSGDEKFDDVVIKSDLLGADVLLGDINQVNPADIFASKKFGALIEELRGRYDTIVIDTPPVLVVPDARVIAQSVDSIVYVVKWDVTQRDQVTSGLREFESVGRPVDGLVLNQIDPRGMRKYGNANNYGPYSAYGAKYYTK